MFARLTDLPSVAKVRHLQGLPPEVTGRRDERRELPSPAFLLLEERADGIFLFRHDAQGRCVGDTWHMSVQDAKDQALFEYPGVSLDWREVPTDVADPVQFGIAQLA
jgi:hypothetical protein